MLGLYGTLEFKLCYEILLLLNMADMGRLLCVRLWTEQSEKLSISLWHYMVQCDIIGDDYAHWVFYIYYLCRTTSILYVYEILTLASTQ